MERILKPDICVIGAGSGGLTVAAAAAAFGVDVVLIEKDRMGGDCLNTGCVPSKALIAAAKRAHEIGEAGRFGISTGLAEVDFQAVHDHVHGVIASIAPHDSEERFTGLGVTVIKGEGRFVDPATVQVNAHLVRARRFVVATGSRAAVPPIPGLAETPFFTNETIFDLTERPDHLVVIGGGPIGLELAQAHRRLGCRVTVVEALTALGKDDPELVEVVRTQIREDGIDLKEDTRVAGVAGSGAAIKISVEGADGEKTIEGSHLLVATGRTPSVTGLGLEEAGIKAQLGGIVVDRGLRTTNRKVYAIGDVAGSFQFTHWASHQAGLVIRSALFRMPVREATDRVTWATYTDPELAQVGLTEAQARDRHKDVQVLRFPFAENDRARTDRDDRGLVKVVTTGRGRILGAGLVGTRAGELVGVWALAIARGLKVNAVAGLILPYPTLNEAAQRAAISYYKPSLSNPWLHRVIKLLRFFG